MPSRKFIIGLSLAIIVCIVAYFKQNTSSENSPIGEISTISQELDVQWKIKNFSSLSRRFYFSSWFSFVNESWFIGIDPNGESKVGGTYIGVYLYRELTGPPIRLKLSFSLKTMNDMKYLERHLTFLFEKQEMYGFQKLISRNELFERKSTLMPSGTLTVICTLKHPAPTEDTRSPEVPLQSKILQDFKELYINREDCDVIIKVKDQDFPVHKIILKARAPVFVSTFENDMKKTGIVNIKDCDPHTFAKFLRFLYWGYTSNLSSENVFSLFTVADKYGVWDLRTVCLEFLKANLSIDTFFETITLATSETELMDLTIDFFVKNAQNIISTAKWRSFIVENPILGNELFIKFMESDANSKE